ncbi:MAG: RNA degradosome polyphosphate kinase, partial [Anaerolineales bacterium]
MSEIIEIKEKPDKIVHNLNDPKYYINRELSLLQFQYRVLEEAQDESNPLLERVKFLAIVADNLDEFFMVRVGGLQMQNDAGVVELSIDGLTPARQLAAIRKVAQKLMQEIREIWHRDLKPKLDEAGIHIIDYDKLSEKHHDHVQSYFDSMVFPVLTPLAFDPGHPFPHISNLSLNLAVLIRDENGDEHFARVKVPSSLPRLMPIKRSSGGVRKDGTVPHHHYFVWIEQAIAANISALFPGVEVIDWYPFRVTRNADFIIQELEADDLLETMQESVRGRRFGSVVRLAVSKAMPDHIRKILVRNLNAHPNSIYTLSTPLGLRSLSNLYNVDRYDLKDTPFLPIAPPSLRGESRDRNILATIRRENILLHHPYNS